MTPTAQRFRQALTQCRDAMLSELQFALGTAVTADKINAGASRVYAEDVRRLVPECTMHSMTLPATEQEHVYLSFGGQYFDAECLEGVARPQELPIFRRQHGAGTTFANLAGPPGYALVS